MRFSFAKDKFTEEDINKLKEYIFDLGEKIRWEKIEIFLRPDDERNDSLTINFFSKYRRGL
jgi:hypothetical protein